MWERDETIGIWYTNTQKQRRCNTLNRGEVILFIHFHRTWKSCHSIITMYGENRWRKRDTNINRTKHVISMTEIARYYGGRHLSQALMEVCTAHF